MSEAWIVRHAQTEWSVAHRHTGRSDIPLTDAGRDDAQALGPRLAGAGFVAVWTSPLSRARETATLAGFPDAVARDELLEWDYGDYEGITTDEVRRDRPGWFLWRDGCPNGETAADVGRRVDPVVEELARLTDPAGQDGRVLVFAHAHLLRVSRRAGWSWRPRRARACPWRPRRCRSSATSGVCARCTCGTRARRRRRSRVQ